MNSQAIKSTASFIVDKSLWFLIGAFCVLLIAIGITETKWFYLLVLLAPFFIYLSIRKPFIFPFGIYALFLPFDGLLSLTGSKGATLTKFLGLLIILVLLLKGIVEKKLKQPDSAALWWLLFVCYGIASIWWSIVPELGLSRIPTLAGLLVLYLIAASYKIERYEYDTLKRCIFLGGLIAAIFIIYNYTTGQAYGGRAEVAIGDRAGGQSAEFLFMPICICVQWMLIHKKKIMKAFFGVVIGIMLVAAIFTGSRATTLGLIAILIVFFASTGKKLIFFALMASIGLAVMFFIPESFLERWEQASETRGSGRLDIWYVGWNILQKYGLFGAGLDNFVVAYNEFMDTSPNFMGFGRAPHNVYIGFFVELGLIGFLLLIMAMVKHYKKIGSRFNKLDTEQTVLKASFWALSIFICFGDELYTKSFWLLWMMIVMYKNVLLRRYS